MGDFTTFVPQDVGRSLKKNLKNIPRLDKKRDYFKEIKKELFKEKVRDD